MPKTKTQQPVHFLLFTAFNIQSFPMCHVISCEANLPPRIQPTEESKPDLPFPHKKHICCMGNRCTHVSEIIIDIRASSL